jgi:hypothetical protein
MSSKWHFYYSCAHPDWTEIVLYKSYFAAIGDDNGDNPGVKGCLFDLESNLDPWICSWLCYRWTVVTPLVSYSLYCWCILEIKSNQVWSLMFFPKSKKSKKLHQKFIIWQKKVQLHWKQTSIFKFVDLPELSNAKFCLFYLSLQLENLWIDSVRMHLMANQKTKAKLWPKIKVKNSFSTFSKDLERTSCSVNLIYTKKGSCCF